MSDFVEGYELLVRVCLTIWLPKCMYTCYKYFCSAIAQLVEQVAVNHPVAGSSPARGAISLLEDSILP